jgi:hypothetical protein
MLISNQRGSAADREIHSSGVGWLLGCRSPITALTTKSFCKRLGLGMVDEAH